MHLLINPTGQPGNFRAVDWAVELLNLFTKVRRTLHLNKSIQLTARQHTHSGSYSNKTVENILKESPLVEMYRQLGKMIERNFYTTKKTTKHQSPDMKKTFKEILSRMETNGTHVMKTERESEFRVNRNLERGLESIQKTAKVRAAANQSNEGMQHEELEMVEDEAELDEEDLMLDDE